MPAAQPYGTPVPAQTNGLAVAAMICGIAGLVISLLCWPLGIVAAIVGIVLGFIGRNRAAEMNGNGAGMALAGIITGFVAVGLSILAIAVLAVSFNVS